MEIGPLEYVVLGMPDQKLTRALVSGLNAIQASGQISVVDLILVTKAADGTVTMREMRELIEEDPAAYGNIADNLMGLLTVQDIGQLTAQVPPDTSAIIVLFEHTWVIGLVEAVRKGRGVVFAGGLVSHEVLAHLSDELAAGKDAQNA